MKIHNSIAGSRAKTHHLSLGRAFGIAACLVLSAVSVLGQEQRKIKNIDCDETMKTRLTREINVIPDFVSEGVLNQAQASEMVTKLKVRLADLCFNFSAPGDIPADPSATAKDLKPIAPSVQDQAKGQSDSQSADAVTQPAARSESLVTAQSASTVSPPTDKDQDKQQNDSFVANFTVGAEQSGYSAQINNTNLFLNAFFRNRLKDFTKDYGFAAWGRVRLLSAPQPSTEGIVSTLSDPTGKITQSSFTQVGQVADFVIGPEISLHYWQESKTRLSFIAGVGATTPLNSNTTVLTYNVPPANTVECQELVNRFGQRSGYVPYVIPDPTKISCIYNPDNPNVDKSYKYIAFSNQDRSNFLSKWGMGFRLERVFAPTEGPKYSGVFDFGVGQDETVTGGKLAGWVFKVDGVYPLLLSKSSLLYVFGSASMRIMPNKDLAPLILTIPQGSAIPTIPSANVIVLPLKQPNRDFYRIGIGLNLVEVFCKLKQDACNNKKPEGKAQGATGTATSDKPAGANGQGAKQRLH